MKTVKVDSRIIKNMLMMYFRYRKRVLVADEVLIGKHGYVADVALVQDVCLTDIEIKIAKDDLNYNEKVNKRWKHFQAKEENYEGVANKFMLCVPEKLKDAATSWIEEVNPKYGMIIVPDEIRLNSFGLEYPHLFGDCVKVFRKAKYLHRRELRYDIRNFYFRMSSSLCTRSYELQKLLHSNGLERK